MSIKNLLLLITGNKGGIGKSYVSILIADYILRHFGREDLIIGDCEASDSQRTFCSCMLESALVLEEQIKIWSMRNDEDFERMMDAISLYNQKKIIVDTGANMLELLTNQIDFLAENMEEINTDVKIIFVIGPAEESTDAAREYLQAIFKYPAIKSYFVLMSAEDLSQGDYHIIKSPEAQDVRQAIDQLKIPLHFIGKTPERFFMQIMREDRLPPSKLLEKLSGSMAAKRFMRWLTDVPDYTFNQILKA